MVREVLRPGNMYAFYAYADIAAARGKYPTLLSQNELELIYRILVHLQPKSVAISDGPSRKMLEHIVRLALPTATLRRKQRAEMAIYEGREGEACPGLPDYAYFTDSSNPEFQALAHKTVHGHIYANPSRALIVLNPKLNAQTFQIRF